jgi:long-chain acyl-CoA synthetase
MSAKLREVFENMPKHFVPGAVDKDTTFYFSLGEGPGEKWTLVVGPKECKVQEGKASESADCVLKTSSELFLKMILEGYTPGVMDFTRGRVKSNNPQLLKELREAFDY